MERRNKLACVLIVALLLAGGAYDEKAVNSFDAVGAFLGSSG
jgi:hypothetical protein